MDVLMVIGVFWIASLVALLESIMAARKEDRLVEKIGLYFSLVCTIISTSLVVFVL